MSAPWFDGFESHRLQLPGRTVHYRLGGALDGPTLLLLHGFPQTSAMWHRVAQRLRGCYHLILPDLRGYGQSRPRYRMRRTTRRTANAPWPPTWWP